MEYGREFYAGVFRLMRSGKADATQELRLLHQAVIDEYAEKGWSYHWGNEDSTIIKAPEPPEPAARIRHHEKLNAPRKAGGSSLPVPPRPGPSSSPSVKRPSPSASPLQPSPKKAKLTPDITRSLSSESSQDTSEYSPLHLLRTAGGSSLPVPPRPGPSSSPSVKRPSPSASPLQPSPKKAKLTPDITRSLSSESSQDTSEAMVVEVKKEKFAVLNLCAVCKSGEENADNSLVQCNECSQYYHQKCEVRNISNEAAKDPRFIFCCSSCSGERVPAPPQPPPPASTPKVEKKRRKREAEPDLFARVAAEPIPPPPPIVKVETSTVKAISSSSLSSMAADFWAKHKGGVKSSGTKSPPSATHKPSTLATSASAGNSAVTAISSSSLSSMAADFWAKHKGGVKSSGTKSPPSATHKPSTLATFASAGNSAVTAISSSFLSSMAADFWAKHKGGVKSSGTKYPPSATHKPSTLATSASAGDIGLGKLASSFQSPTSGSGKALPGSRMQQADKKLADLKKKLKKI